MTDYHADFFAWTQEAAALIKQRRLEDLDWDALADEIESMGKRDRRAMISRMIVIEQHLLKLAYQPDKAGKSWHPSIDENSTRLALDFADSPSLRAQAGELIAIAYPFARRRAARETGLEESTFPAACPFTVDEVLAQ